MTDSAPSAKDAKNQISRYAGLYHDPLKGKQVEYYVGTHSIEKGKVIVEARDASKLQELFTLKTALTDLGFDAKFNQSGLQAKLICTFDPKKDAEKLTALKQEADKKAASTMVHNAIEEPAPSADAIYSAIKEYIYASGTQLVRSRIGGTQLAITPSVREDNLTLTLNDNAMREGFEALTAQLKDIGFEVTQTVEEPTKATPEKPQPVEPEKYSLHVSTAHPATKDSLKTLAQKTKELTQQAMNTLDAQEKKTFFDNKGFVKQPIAGRF